MTARYFAVNSLAGASRSGSSVVDITTAGQFDSAYVASAINIPNLTDHFAIKQPFLDGSTSLTTVFWLRFDINTNGGSNNTCCLMLNGASNAYRIQYTSGGTSYQVQYWNSGSSAWVNWGGTFTLTNSAVRTLALKLTPNVSYEVFVGGTSLANSAVVPTNGASAVTEFRFFGFNGTSYSQIMGADYDIRSAHVMPGALNGNSATNTGGTGAYTDINETTLSDATVENITVSGNKMGQTHAAITLPAGLNIAGAVINARGMVSGGTITDGKVGVRSGGTNYSSSALAYSGSFEPRGYIWLTNPNTSTAWTQTTFNNAETYLEAV